ncbi:MAG: transcriptional regulator, winged helix family, partial [Frankiales bacterium]|nr:transcriptional regulator, winged helix family [Frankiales bacterium]
MQLSVLGPLEVSDAGRTLEISGVRLRRLLLRLGVDKQRVVSAEQLVVAVWGTALAGRPTDQINALQTLISRLRRTLGAAAEIQQVPGGYRLASQSELTTDVELFCELAEQARRALAGGDPGLAADLFARGLDLWRGPALADAGDAEYARPLAAKWEEQRLDVQAERVEARLLLGPDEALIADLEALAGQFTIREQFTGQLMAALAAAGRPAEALAAYERLRTFLAD